MAFKCDICSQYFGSKQRYKGGRTCKRCNGIKMVVWVINDR